MYFFLTFYTHPKHYYLPERRHQKLRPRIIREESLCSPNQQKKRAKTPQSVIFAMNECKFCLSTETMENFRQTQTLFSFDSNFYCCCCCCRVPSRKFSVSLCFPFDWIELSEIGEEFDFSLFSSSFAGLIEFRALFFFPMMLFCSDAAFFFFLKKLISFPQQTKCWSSSKTKVSGRTNSQIYSPERFDAKNKQRLLLIFQDAEWGKRFVARYFWSTDFEIFVVALFFLDVAEQKLEISIFGGSRVEPSSRKPNRR